MANTKSLLSSRSRVQIPWIKVTIGDYTFGVFNKTTLEANKNNQGFFNQYKVQYPNFIQNLDIVKINGQVNQYTLNINYPVTQFDDPNFFEKVFSSVSNTRKIVFSYGDAAMPTYCYKDEEAIITSINQSFSFGSGGSMSSVIGYTISAVSTGSLGLSGCYSFMAREGKPSDIIKQLFRNNNYGLKDLFKGMNESNLDSLIQGGDKAVKISGKQNISILDYITYLVSCMIPQGTSESNISKDIYILTIHDDSIYDPEFDTGLTKGAYFKVAKTSYMTEQADAYELNIGFGANNSTIVSNFSVENNNNYSIYYDYQNKLNQEYYVSRLDNDGNWEQVYAPNISSKNDLHTTRANDTTWWTKITRYPVNASITIQGLLRPATLMQYVRLNVVFPGGNKHLSSGLYIITKQQDHIDGNGYKTTLSLTKISGDSSPTTVMLSRE